MKKLLKFFLLSFTVTAVLSFFSCSSSISEDDEKNINQTEITIDADSARYGFGNCGCGTTGHSPSGQSSVSSK